MTRISIDSSLAYSKIYFVLFIGLLVHVAAFSFNDNSSDSGFFIQSTNFTKSKNESELALEESQAEMNEESNAKLTDTEADITVNSLSDQNTLADETADETEYILDRQVLLKKQREVMEAFVQQTPNFDNVSIKSKDVDNDTSHINETLDVDANNTIHINETESVETNETASNVTQRKRWECTPTPFQVDVTSKVRIVNDPEITEALTKSNETEECFLLYFFLKWCHFCAEMSVEINTIGRLYPMLPVLAVDAINSSSVAAKFGVAGVPTLLLFYSGRPVVKFNRTRTLDDLQLFIKETTDFDAEGKLEINDADFDGPLPTKIEERKDIYLTFSLAFLALLSIVTTVRTKMCQNILKSIKERVSRLWRTEEEEHDKQE